MGKGKDIIELKLELPGSDKFMGVLLSFIDEATRAFGLEKEESLKIRLAAEETVKNVIEHGLENNINESFSVIFKNMPDRIEIIVKEKGIPFDFDFEGETGADKRKKGLGILLIKSVVDEVYFRNLGRDGKETRIVKYKSSDDVRNFLTAEETRGIKPKKVSYFIRDFEKEDALEVSKCAYRSYGYTYESFVYYPSQIVRMNENGSLISAVAITKGEGDIAGHGALKFYNRNTQIAELGVVFVNPLYRNNGISWALTNYLKKKAQQSKDIRALYIRAVTAHVYSQNLVLKLGFIPTGIMLNMFHDEVSFEGITKTSTKTSAVLGCLPVKKMGRRTLFVPDRDREMVGKIMSELGGECNMGKPEKPPSESEERIEYSKNELFNVVDIYCKSYNDKTPMLIKRTLMRVLAQKADMVYLYLDMENPYTPDIVSRMSDLGFFFCGVLPFGMDGNHTIIYQYANMGMDFDLINLADDFSGKILDHIKRQAVFQLG